MNPIRSASIQWRSFPCLCRRLHFPPYSPHAIKHTPLSYPSFQTLRSASTLAESEKNDNVKVAIAVSGGVDSMALAFLTKASAQEGDHIHAFIVDHGLRPNSAEEATQTVRNLRRLGISANVLTLDRKILYAGSQVETLARKARFRALGKACVKWGFSNLLLAHHRDDVYETALIRLGKSATYNLGMMGEHEDTYISNCDGIFQAHQSGAPQDFLGPPTPRYQFTTSVQGFEQGGVNISRPLVGFFKQELIDICRNNDIPWIEDESNKDVALTSRNVIRNVLTDDVLPKALQRTALLDFRTTIHQHYSNHKLIANILFNQCQLRFNPSLGYLLVQYIPLTTQHFKSLIQASLPLDQNQNLNHHFVLSLLIARLALIVDAVPKTYTSNAGELATVWLANGDIYAKTGKVPHKKARFSQVLIDNHPIHIKDLCMVHGFSKEDLNNPNIWLFSRQIPNERFDSRSRGRVVHLTNHPADTNIFFDGRFWLCISNLSGFPLTIRPSKVFETLDQIQHMFIHEGYQIHVAYSPWDSPSVQKAVSFAVNDKSKIKLLELAWKSLYKYCSKTWNDRLKALVWSLGTTLQSFEVPVVYIVDQHRKEHLFSLPTLGVQLEPKSGPLCEAYRQIKIQSRYKQVDWGNHLGPDKSRRSDLLILPVAENHHMSEFHRWAMTLPITSSHTTSLNQTDLQRTIIQPSKPNLLTITTRYSDHDKGRLTRYSDPDKRRPITRPVPTDKHLPPTIRARADASLRAKKQEDDIGSQSVKSIKDCVRRTSSSIAAVITKNLRKNSLDFLGGKNYTNPSAQDQDQVQTPVINADKSIPHRNNEVVSEINTFVRTNDPHGKVIDATTSITPAIPLYPSIPGVGSLYSLAKHTTEVNYPAINLPDIHPTHLDQDREDPWDRVALTRPEKIVLKVNSLAPLVKAVGFDEPKTGSKPMPTPRKETFVIRPPSPSPPLAKARFFVRLKRGSDPSISDDTDLRAKFSVSPLVKTVLRDGIYRPPDAPIVERLDLIPNCMPGGLPLIKKHELVRKKKRKIADGTAFPQLSHRTKRSSQPMISKRKPDLEQSNSGVVLATKKHAAHNYGVTGLTTPLRSRPPSPSISEATEPAIQKSIFLQPEHKIVRDFPKQDDADSSPKPILKQPSSTTDLTDQLIRPYLSSPNVISRTPSRVTASKIAQTRKFTTFACYTTHSASVELKVKYHFMDTQVFDSSKMNGGKGDGRGLVKKEANLQLIKYGIQARKFRNDDNIHPILYHRPPAKPAALSKPSNLLKHQIFPTSEISRRLCTSDRARQPLLVNRILRTSETDRQLPVVHRVFRASETDWQPRLKRQINRTPKWSRPPLVRTQPVTSVVQQYIYRGYFPGTLPKPEKPLESWQVPALDHTKPILSEVKPQMKPHYGPRQVESFKCLRRTWVRNPRVPLNTRNNPPFKLPTSTSTRSDSSYRAESIREAPHTFNVRFTRQSSIDDSKPSQGFIIRKPDPRPSLKVHQSWLRWRMRLFCEERKLDMDGRLSGDPRPLELFTRTVDYFGLLSIQQHFDQLDEAEQEQESEGFGDSFLHPNALPMHGKQTPVSPSQAVNTSKNPEIVRWRMRNLVRLQSQRHWLREQGLRSAVNGVPLSSGGLLPWPHSEIAVAEAAEAGFDVPLQTAVGSGDGLNDDGLGNALPQRKRKPKFGSKAWNPSSGEDNDDDAAGQVSFEREARLSVANEELFDHAFEALKPILLEKFGNGSQATQKDVFKR